MFDCFLFIFFLLTYFIYFHYICLFLHGRLFIFFVLLFTGSRGAVRYSIYSGDPDGYFNIDPVSGNIRISSPLDHETKPQVLLNVQATSGDPPAYGHTQVIISEIIIFSFYIFLHFGVCMHLLSIFQQHYCIIKNI